MAHPSVSSRAALIMSAAALVMSAGFAGGPALARAIVANSDKVDGLHAVKATATTAQRKGKLVATDAGTGAFRANVIPNAAKFPATIPGGVTLIGAFSVETQNAGNGDYGSTIDFGGLLSGVPAVVFMAPGSMPTTDCPGAWDNPLAAPGVLCMYASGMAGLNPTTLSGDFTRYGVHWHLQTTTALPVGADVYARGSYAVQAPFAPKAAVHHNSDGK